MSNISGIIEKVYCKAGERHPKYGVSYQTSVTIAGTRYGGFTKKDADSLGLVVGAEVSFDTEQKGEYLNFVEKTIKVVKAAAKPAAGAPAKGGGYNERGVKVGHALNNAVQLAIAKGDLSSKTIETYAIGMMRLSVKLESQYDDLIAPKTQGSEAPAAPPATPTPPPAPAPAPPAAPAPAAFDDDIPF